MSLKKIKDTISPDLRRRAKAAGDKRPHLMAMGTAVKALGQEAFTDPAKRPTQWAARKDDKPHPLLMESGTLEGSLRVVTDGASRVIIESDRPYAATHQLGRDNIPERPFLPFHKGGRITGLGNRRVERALIASLRSRGL